MLRSLILFIKLLLKREKITIHSYILPHNNYEQNIKKQSPKKTS